MAGQGCKVAINLNPAVRDLESPRKAFERSNFQLLRRFTFRVRTASACSAGGQITKNDGLAHRSLLKASLQLPDLGSVARNGLPGKSRARSP